MKKLLLASVAGFALLGAAPAGAADLQAAQAIAPLPVPVPVFTWTGAYLGGNVGGLDGEFRSDPVTATFLGGRSVGRAPPVSAISFTMKRGTDLIGGIQTGYRWQLGSLVLGLEQDAQFTDLERSFALPEELGPRPGETGRLGGAVFSNRLKFLSATRGQIGFAFDRLLVYATGGLETGVMDVSALFPARSGRGSPALSYTDRNKFHIGFTVGGGGEYAITDNISLGIDYRYVELKRETYNLGAVVGEGSNAFSTMADVDFKGHEVLGRINVKTSGLFGLF
jgi:outer membrane immunogenic protein